MTLVGSRRMIVYDDAQPPAKIKIYDLRVETPPHYDTFAEFHYAYHYGDSYIPYVKQEEPLRVECQHFLDCIRRGANPYSTVAKGCNWSKSLKRLPLLSNKAVDQSLLNGGSNGVAGASQEQLQKRVREAAPCI